MESHEGYEFICTQVKVTVTWYPMLNNSKAVRTTVSPFLLQKTVCANFPLRIRQCVTAEEK
jgi:hypothetical protein